jgi:carbon-monoxide dehydrogenase medium subunit/xanthine dehydrogenase FAD-binding subunit
MKKFNFYTPVSLKEALELLSEHKGRCAIIAGGTDVIVALRQQRLHPECLININKLKELRFCKPDNGKVRIGALSTFADLENDPYIKNSVKSLYYCCCHMGSPQIRNLATIGGNLVNASPAADSTTTLLSLDASIVLESTRGRREMKLADFYANCQNTQIASDELMTEIYFDAPTDDIATAAYKLGKRKALAIVVVGLSVMIERDSSNRIKRALVVLGALTKTPMHIKVVEEYLTGKPLTAQTFQPCGQMLSKAIQEVMRAGRMHKALSSECIAERTFGQILSEFGSR